MPGIQELLQLGALRRASGPTFTNAKSVLFPAWPTDTANIEIGSSGFNPARTSAFSYSAWLKLNSSANPGIATLISSYDAAGSPAKGFLARSNNANLQIYFGDNFGSGNYFLLTYTEFWTGYFGAWTHVVITYDGSSNGNGVKVYRNGTLVAYSTLSPNNMGSGSTATSIGTIGDSNISGAITNWYGGMDEISLYSEALSGAEVTTLYNNGVPSTPAAASLTHWYRMGDDPDTTATIEDNEGFADGTATDITLSTDVPG